MYPEVTRANVASQLCAQTLDQHEREALLDQIMVGAQALREYPSGCPPPCALAPIQPPLCADAQLLFVPQAPRSKGDRDFMDAYVATRLSYGIDEPGLAHANLPVYSLPKPNTDARQVILDNSVGSAINMTSIGIDLPRLHTIRQFVANAVIITSLDLASYFTAICLHPNCRDF
ncbi:hypothetical protein IWQ60_004828 [Tieghemiomyces parasiticus]|uniref:Uncharacterized protein n=1 Tax=Tieghemiomyces parasiticus TaxID=78921 RepID=A0A9W8DYS9_9FUNG|nr:hypothetical protein IWQ60_004828 [Tieghemiomyces parasiticus]